MIIVNGRTTTTDAGPWVFYKLNWRAFGSGELITSSKNSSPDRYTVHKKQGILGVYKLLQNRPL